MRRTHLMGALLAAATASGVVVSTEGTARACGGCFTPPPPPSVTEAESVITDEKMILSISMTQTTLYDEIEYSGSPSSFAWVLPIKGTVTVGLSADILFQTIGQLTATTVTSPPENCPPPPTCGGGGGGGCGSSSSGTGFASGLAAPNGYTEDSAGDAGAVTVLGQEQVGPYESVQLHSSDGSALNNWLSSHGYAIPADVKPVIDAYVQQQFDFLALKLVPGVGVHAMQPVRVTSQGAAPTLPLHMVAVGTGPTTGITIWVVADGRWQPTNFPTFVIPDSQLSWDWATSSSNYETLRLADEAALNGRGWQIESSLELAQYTITSSVLGNIQAGGPGGYLSTGTSSAGDGGTGGGDASVGDASVGDASFGDAESSGDAESAGEGGGGDAGQGDLNAANQDLAVLLQGIAAPNVRITRMRSDIARSALTTDMILEASTDQSELTNAHVPVQEIGEPLCPLYDSNCNETGEAPRSQAVAAANSNSSSGCTTTPAQNSMGSTLVFLVGVAGVSAVRARYRRRR
jgi:hypothetical protein